jgi:SAM-dependent methyltransferase
VNIPSLALDGCPACGPSIFVSLAPNEVGIRCMRCGGTPITLSLVDVLRSRLPDLARLDVYEMSSRGPLVNYLRRMARSLTLSEYFEDATPGSSRNGVQCQDATQLTFPDGSFDLCTSTEVFEHIADDASAFKEVLRVLRPGGTLMFTVPVGDHPTGIRARLDERGDVVHFEPPEYHSDRLRGTGKVLCFRNYGTDIDALLLRQGYESAQLVWPRQRWFGVARRVIVARKAKGE